MSMEMDEAYVIAPILSHYVSYLNMQREGSGYFAVKSNSFSILMLGIFNILYTSAKVFALFYIRCLVCTSKRSKYLDLSLSLTPQICTFRMI